MIEKMEKPQADIREINKRYNEWAKSRFPNSTPVSSLKGLEREAKEAYEEIEHFNELLSSGKLDDNDGGFDVCHEAIQMEYADCLMYIIDSARRFGLTLDDLFFALDRKLQINLKRDWKQNDDKSYSHIK